MDLTCSFLLRLLRKDAEQRDDETDAQVWRHVVVRLTAARGAERIRREVRGVVAS
jgi:hypothetical protein